MGLYLHIPFCAQRCVYCDFYFTTTRRDFSSFVDALCAELRACAATYAADAPLETIYFGGGTPSLLSPSEIERILETVRTHFDAGSVQETTLELNPGDVSPDYLRALHALGIDRLSIGIQSFYADDLRWMNRSHTAEEAEAIVPLAREAGFDNFSADLIFGLPEQPDEYWKANLEKVARLGVPHLSTYGLTLEEKTPFFNQVERGLVTPASEAVMEARFRHTMEYLRARGYEHYEISSFAKPGRRARHNQKYWQHDTVLAAGPSAHAFRWTGDEERPAVRWSNVAHLRRYEALLQQHQQPLAEREPLALPTLADEYLMLRLRTADGLDLGHFRTRYDRDLRAEQPDALRRLDAEGYLEIDAADTLRLTDEGKMVCDTVTAALLAGGNQ